MILTDQFGESAGSMAACECGSVHAGQATCQARSMKADPMNSGGMRKTRADRGDLYTLTAATFTVLTGFTRAGPAGPGIGKL